MGQMIVVPGCTRTSRRGSATQQIDADGQRRASGAAVAALFGTIVLWVAAIPAPAHAGEIAFEDVTGASNLDVLIGDTEWHASAWGDVTGNGFPDLFVGYFQTTHSGVDNRNRLLFNVADGQGGRMFIDSGQSVIEAQNMRVSGNAIADFNNSGHLDLVATHHGSGNHTRIYENLGSGTFTERTSGSNLDFEPFAGRTPFVADFLGNGRLDILLQHDVYAGQTYMSRLMRNDGDFQFTDVTAAANLPIAGGGNDGVLGLGGAVADFTGNGAPDFLSVGPTRGNWQTANNRMFLNNADGTFSEYQSNSVFNDPTEWVTHSNDDWNVGAAVGDLNNNGRMDLIIGQHFSSALEGPNVPHAVQVYLNQGVDGDGQPIFVNATVDLDIPAFNSRIPHIEIRDMDNDGFLDIVLSVGLSHDDHNGAQHPVVLRNLLGETGQLTFAMPDGQDASTFSGPYDSTNRWFNDPNIDPMYWPGAPVADFDRDGRLDVMGQEAIWPLERDSPLFRNVTDNDNRFVQIMVDASALEDVNNQGVGSRVMLFEAGQAHDLDALLGTTEIQITNGYSSGVEAMAHFGAGLRDWVDVVVELPWGADTWTIEWLPTNTFYLASGSAVVPEPSSAALLALAGLGLLGRRRRSRADTPTA